MRYAGWDGARGTITGMSSLRHEGQAGGLFRFIFVTIHVRLPLPRRHGLVELPLQTEMPPDGPDCDMARLMERIWHAGA